MQSTTLGNRDARFFETVDFEAARTRRTLKKRRFEHDIGSFFKRSENTYVFFEHGWLLEHRVMVRKNAGNFQIYSRAPLRFFWLRGGQNSLRVRAKLYVKKRSASNALLCKTRASMR